MESKEIWKNRKESYSTSSSIMDATQEKDLNAAYVIIENYEAETGLLNSSELKIIKNGDYNSNLSKSTSNEKQTVKEPVFSKCLHDDDDNEDEDSNSMPPLKILAVNGCPSGLGSEIFQPESAIPARTNWEGPHNFKIMIQCNDTPKKSENVFFSELQKKLYVAKDHPFKVLVSAKNVPSFSTITVSAIFAMVEHTYEPVHRCPTHAQADFSKGDPLYEHFVQSFSESAFYTKNSETKKLSVSVPYEEPKEGENYSAYFFKLTCFSSCSGGINRRPFILVFTLEKDNFCLGRQILETKVCACPQRDFKVDEERPNRKRSRTHSADRSFADGENVKPLYTIKVQEPDLYDFLTHMKHFYELSTYASKLKSGG